MVGRMSHSNQHLATRKPTRSTSSRLIDVIADGRFARNNPHMEAAHSEFNAPYL